MWESYIVAQARQWVNQGMTWVGQSSGLSNFYAVMNGDQQAPASGTQPGFGWSMTCYEMPLLAAVHSRSIDRALAAQVARDPENRLRRYWTRNYDDVRCGGIDRPTAGDLVFWKQRVANNGILARLLGPDDNPNRWGLDHVALATGNTAHNGHSEVISFWTNNTIELTDVNTITTNVQNALGNNAIMDVTYASGPWGYW